MDLLELRKEIDRIDDQLIPLLMARMDVSEQVAKYKVERGIPVLNDCLLYTSPSPRDRSLSRMPSSA